MYRCICLALGLSMAALAGTEVAAQSCLSEFEAQKRQLTGDIAAAGRDLRRLRARLDAQEMRLAQIPDAALQATVPPAPAIPELPAVTLGDQQGCTEPVTAEQQRVAELLAGLDAVQTALEQREVALAAAEAGTPQTVASTDDVATTDEVRATPQVSEGAQADAPASPDAQETVVDAPEDTAPDMADDPAPEAGMDTASQPSTHVPLAVADSPDLFQRIIVLPGAQMREAAGVVATGTALPVFSVLYVFERQEAGGSSWLRVGETLRDGPQGWLEAGQTMDWSTMLVMQFSPRGKRNPVLFFENDAPLRDIISGPFYQNQSLSIYRSLQDERARLTQGEAPSWPEALVAVEPETAIRFDDKPYLLPILDWRHEMFDGTIDTTLVKVAALPAAADAQVGQRDEGSLSASASDAARDGAEFRVGVVFVVDTTVSMRPFIERTNQAIQGFYDAFSRFETAQYVSFGLMGFRDTIETDPERLEYVTRNFQPLDVGLPAASVLSNMGEMREATVSNLGFAEDAVAGMVDALDENDWSPFDARLMILVTDASARLDSHAKYPDMTLERLREKARAQNVTIVPIHLLTPANATEDAAIARQQYTLLAQTGDLAEDKYLSLDATDPDVFARELSAMAQEIAGKIMVANAGEMVRDPSADMEPMPAPIAAADAGEGDGRLASIIGNEIFRAQLESLGRADDAAAPAFLAGWATDRDLADPNIETMEVSVYLTRNQLSTLDKRLSEIVDAFRRGGSDPQTFFANLQLLAAQTSTDPQSVRSGDRSTIEAILPGFLQKLPYRSQVLRLDQSYWSAMSVSQQQEFIENLETKRRIYADLFGQTHLWAELGAGDPGLEATPIRLTNLP